MLDVIIGCRNVRNIQRETALNEKLYVRCNLIIGCRDVRNRQSETSLNEKLYVICSHLLS